MKIYRIENPTTYHGMWYDANGNYCPTIHDLCPNSVAKDFPMGFNPVHKTDNKNWYSAGKSKDNMNFWFSKEDAMNLVANGFVLYEIHATETMELENEILFTREGVLTYTPITIEDVWI